jgi:signal-transduction protein with cAMP-binding, CBS, and nucleotidyltransferase domain
MPDSEELQEELAQLYSEPGQLKYINTDTFSTFLYNLNLGQLAAVDTGVTVEEAISKMQEKSTGCVVVVSENERLIGLFTERDVLMKIALKGINVKKEKVDSYMTRHPETLNYADTISSALNLMSTGGYRHIPIVDDANMPGGVVSIRDIVNFIVDHFHDEILNFTPKIKHPEKREGA